MLGVRQLQPLLLLPETIRAAGVGKEEERVMKVTFRCPGKVTNPTQRPRSSSPESLSQQAAKG